MALDKNGKLLPRGISYREKEARYMGRFMYHGIMYTVYGKTAKDVENALEEMKYQVKCGTYFKEDSVTFDAWFEIWIKDYKEPTVKIGTVNVYRQNYNAYIHKAFGSKQLRDVLPVNLQRFYNIMAKTYPRNTLEICRAILNGMYQQAIRNEIIQKNPVKNAVLPKDNKRHSARVMSLNEQKLFLKFAQNTIYYPIYEMALSTGMRSGELRGLCWTDVDFINRQIHIVHALVYINGKHYMDSPKTISSVRDIPMLENVYQLLKKQRKKQLEDRMRMGELWKPEIGLDNLVFTNTYGKPIYRDRLNKEIDKIVNRITSSGYTFPHITPHTFRHTFATRSIEQGIQPKTLQTILGHTDLSTTMDTYAHVLPDTKAAEMQKLSGLF